ncbi:MAG: hypothetical protein FWH26_06010 [Oscillospiraceae bacterium]|nr:hypothetical protein [Oscillospiraceae bacterium]
MVLSNWIELAALVLGIAIGLILWQVCKRRLKQEGGFEGIVTERGKLPKRRPLDVEEEIKQLKERLGRK